MTTTRWLLLIACPIAAPPVGSAAEPAPKAWAGDLAPITEQEWNYQRAAHLLERAGFGGTPEEVEKLAKMTPAQAVDYLVDYEKTDEGKLPVCEPSGIYPNEHKLVGLDKVVVKGILTGKAYGVKATQPPPLKYQPAVTEFYTLLISEHAEMRRFSQAWAERMLVTKRPLQEKLTFYWHDHFATSQEKVANYELMLAHIDVLRKNANGNLRALLIAIAQDPAMLIWLDNKDNVKGKPNENFAREVMELFCMGEGQGYTEKDIREMARAFTGWTLKPIETAKDVAKLVDDKTLHDDGEKTFLGKTGKFNGYDAIDIILAQPATARFVSRKLYRSFVRGDVPPELHDKLAKLLVDSKYELKPFLKTIFLSRDFYSPAVVGTQIKSPVHYVVSTYRKLGLQNVPGIPDYADVTSTLGQMLYYPPNVAGWPGHRTWINPSTLLTRGNFAHTLLFPDPDTYGAPDKVVAEGYRKIPLMFPEYKITPHVFNTKTQKMEPVSLFKYDQYLAGIDTGAMKAMGGKPPEAKKDDKPLLPGAKDAESKMMAMSKSEDYNLAVGVYDGFIEAYRRVKPLPRTAAAIDFVAMLRAAKVDTAEAAVDHLGTRFLSTPLSAKRRDAVVAFLKKELGADTIDFDKKGLDLILRQTVHLILSAPEYQLG